MSSPRLPRRRHWGTEKVRLFWDPTRKGFGSREGACAGTGGATGVPTPTVSKVLATLARHGLLHSVRGAKGGYRLAAGPQDISVAEIISVIDGPIALTQCIEHAPGVCEIESFCSCREPWQVINDVVRRSLEAVSLADIAAPMPSFPASAHRGRGAPHIASGSHG